VEKRIHQTNHQKPNVRKQIEKEPVHTQNRLFLDFFFSGISYFSFERVIESSDCSAFYLK